MSRKLLIFLLSELQVVRVICKAEGCGAVSEVGIAQAEEMFAEPYCKRCRTGFFRADGFQVQQVGGAGESDPGDAGTRRGSRRGIRRARHRLGPSLADANHISLHHYHFPRNHPISFQPGSNAIALLAAVGSSYFAAPPGAIPVPAAAKGTAP